MIPLQSFRSIYSHGLPIGNLNHYCGKCIYKHLNLILNWFFGDYIAHKSTPLRVHIIAGLSTCAELNPIASIFTKRGLKHSTAVLTELLSLLDGFTSLKLSKCPYGSRGLSSHLKCTLQQGNEVQAFDLTRSKTASRPSGNDSQERFFKQDVHLIDNYKEIATCH